jgi:hypothetical protein
VKQVKDSKEEEFLLSKTGWDELENQNRYYISELPRDIKEGITNSVSTMPADTVLALSKLSGEAWSDYSHAARKQMGKVFRFLVLDGQFPVLEAVEEPSQSRHRLYRVNGG